MEIKNKFTLPICISLSDILHIMQQHFNSMFTQKHLLEMKKILIVKMFFGNVS